MCVCGVENIYISFDFWLTVSANPIAVPIRWFGTVAVVCNALVNRVAVPPARADGGRVDIGRADVKPLLFVKICLHTKNDKNFGFIGKCLHKLAIKGCCCVLLT